MNKNILADRCEAQADEELNLALYMLDRRDEAERDDPVGCLSSYLLAEIGGLYALAAVLRSRSERMAK